MRSVYFFASLIIVAVVAVILLLFAHGPNRSSADNQTDLPSAVLENTAEEPVRVDTSAHIPERVEPVGTNVVSQEDSPALLTKRCGQCHMATLLKQYKKSRPEWEITLVQMEAFGLQLNDDERELLLDYLSATEQP